MTGKGETPSRDRLDDTADANFEHVLGSYLDRLTEGDFLDPEEVRAAYPRIAEALLEHLASFIEVAESAEAETATSLGTLGDYTLRRQIGRGGMGVVYDAWQGSLDRQVALKVLPAALCFGCSFSFRNFLLCFRSSFFNFTLTL